MTRDVRTYQWIEPGFCPYCGSADVDVYRGEDMGEPEWDIRCRTCGRGVEGACPDHSTFRECGLCEHYEPQSPYRGRCKDGVEVAGDKASNHVDADGSCVLFRIAECHRYLGDIDHAMLWKALKENPSAPLGLMLKMEEQLGTTRELTRVHLRTVDGFEAVDADGAGGQPGPEIFCRNCGTRIPDLPGDGTTVLRRRCPECGLEREGNEVRRDDGT